MQTGKSKSSQKTREPYGKVTDVGQVPIALLEIKELACFSARKEDPVVDQRKRLEKIDFIITSIVVVTCANPGCISEMAEQSRAA